MEKNSVINPDQISELIEKLCKDGDNRLWPDSHEPAWDKPLVGFCRGDDPIFDHYKQVVGSFHWTPLEAFQLAFPETPAKAEELGVVVWILPQTEKTKRDNRVQDALPSERWARSRIFGEVFNSKLRERVSQELTESGFPAVAPMLLPDYGSVDSEKYIYASTWSERHMAHAAGLGTFGLCDGLITPAGKAMRVGSVVAKISVPKTERPYANHYKYCLFLSKGTCGLCIDRCPAGAISKSGHDKRKCRDYLNSHTRPYVTQTFGFAGYGCGLCQTDVPCESEIPPPDGDMERIGD